MNKTIEMKKNRLINQIILHRKKGQVNNVVKDIKLSWQEKNLLIRVLSNYGFDCLVSESIDTLVLTLNISYKHIKRSQKVLESLGVLSFDRVTDGRGRPARSFIIDSECLRQLVEDLHEQVVPHHPELINSLLCFGECNNNDFRDLTQGANTRSRGGYLKDRDYGLDGKSRFFLAVLLAHADEFGFVESLGRADIEALTGLSSDQQKLVVKKLMRSGYVRSVIQGFTSSKVFGRVSTVYCLNVNSGEIPGVKSIALTIFRDVLLRPVHNLPESCQLQKAANSFLRSQSEFEREEDVLIRSLVDHNDRLEPIYPDQIELLKGIRSKPFYTYLQFRLESYACWFLSTPSYQGDSSAICDDELEGVRRQVLRDVSVNNDADRATEAERELAYMLNRIAGVIADTYHQLLSKYKDLSLVENDAKFRVLPRDLRVKTFLTIAVRGGQLSRKSKSCVYIQGHHAYLNDSSQEMTICDEVDLDEELRKNCGLLAL